MEQATTHPDHQDAPTEEYIILSDAEGSDVEEEEDQAEQRRVRKAILADAKASKTPVTSPASSPSRTPATTPRCAPKTPEDPPTWVSLILEEIRLLPRWVTILLMTSFCVFTTSAVFLGGYTYGSSQKHGHAAPTAPAAAVSAREVAAAGPVLKAEACGVRAQDLFPRLSRHTTHRLALDNLFGSTRSLFSPFARADDLFTFLPFERLASHHGRRRHHGRRQRRAAIEPYRHHAPPHHYQVFLHHAAPEVPAQVQAPAAPAAPPQEKPPAHFAARDDPAEVRTFADLRSRDSQVDTRADVETEVAAPPAPRPEAATLSAAPRRPTATTSDRDALRGLSIKQLRAILQRYGRGGCPTCKEKDDLVNEVIHAINADAA